MTRQVVNLRADGTATFDQAIANQAADITSPAGCVSIAEWNSAHTSRNIAGIDLNLIGLGGTLAQELQVTRGGSERNPFRVRGFDAVMDVSGITAEPAACLHIFGDNLDGIDVDNLQDMTGNGGRAVVRVTDNSASGNSIRLGMLARLVATANNVNAFSGTQVRDGFSFNGGARAKCGVLVANDCAAPTPNSNDSFNGLTTHEQCFVEVDRYIGARNHDHVALVGGSELMIRDVQLGDAYRTGFLIGATGGSLSVSGGTLAITSDGASLFQVNDGAGPESILDLRRIVMSLTQTATATNEANFDCHVILNGCDITIDAPGVRWQGYNNGALTMLDGILRLIAWNAGTFLENNTQDGSTSIDINMTGTRFMGGDGVAGGGRVFLAGTHAAGSLNLAGTIWDQIRSNNPAIQANSTSAHGVNFSRARVYDAQATAVNAFYRDTRSGVPDADEITDVTGAIFVDCPDALNVSDFKFIAGEELAEYLGSTPDESSNDIGVKVYRDATTGILHFE
ncbi:MAG: hypothetical protein AAFR07_05535 [Pseudomonadota bacterium]